MCDKQNQPPILNTKWGQPIDIDDTMGVIESMQKTAENVCEHYSMYALANYVVSDIWLYKLYIHSYCNSRLLCSLMEHVIYYAEYKANSL